ncbi:Fic/DOC family protein [Nocardia sp. alder85J]|uniref:Fic/DOC family protein n=1 Tax=Nocardia sp. alder85J TaxID=2862949 RepID=UPI001CD705FB|nr:Fic family protein [Nocardia sp. alder85J]MCX4094471.1 Fic family protein [Nocardia sp. alder85J]
MTSPESSEWDSYLTTGADGRPMLRNTIGAVNDYHLWVLEFREVMARTQEIRSGAALIPRTGDLAQWRAIHAHQFGNIYAWAGRLRTTGMSKNGTGFATPGELEPYLTEHIPAVARMPWHTMGRNVFVEAVAWSFSVLNAAHPFREGNGRSLRVFLDQLSEHAHWRIDYSQVSDRDGAERWDAACHATRARWPDIDPAPLAELFDRIIEIADVSAAGQAGVMPTAQRRVLGLTNIRPAEPSHEVPDSAPTSETHAAPLDRDIDPDLL